MSDYVRVEGGSIVAGPGPCPKAWANIAGFDRLHPTEQRNHGWFPYEGAEPPTCDTRTHKVVSRVVFGPVVRVEHAVEPLTGDEVAANLEGLRQEILARNADYRWQKEIGGIDFYGYPPREIPIPIHTDRQSQHAIFQALHVGESKNWKCRDGEWRLFTQEDFALLYASIDQHRQICFETEAENASLIQGCDTFAELDALDLEALWNSE